MSNNSRSPDLGFFWKCCLIASVVLIFGLGQVWATYKTTIYDTPTAITLEKGEYSVESFFYGKGGTLFKFDIGINTFINLGGTEYIDRLIGSERPIFHIPNISARIRFTDRPLDSFNLAIGFDSLYHGTAQPIYGKKLYGLYFVFTKGVNVLDSPQLFTIGIRQPLIYEIIEPDIFASIYFNFFAYFHFAFEIHNIHFVNQHGYYFINNNLLIFRPVQELSIEINLQLALPYKGGHHQDSSLLFSKEFRITYQSFF